MTEKNINQDFRLKNIEEINNHLVKEIDQNELVRKKRKKSINKLY